MKRSQTGSAAEAVWSPGHHHAGAASDELRSPISHGRKSLSSLKARYEKRDAAEGGSEMPLAGWNKDAGWRRELDSPRFESAGWTAWYRWTVICSAKHHRARAIGRAN